MSNSQLYTDEQLDHLLRNQVTVALEAAVEVVEILFPEEDGEAVAAIMADYFESRHLVKPENNKEVSA